VLQASADELSSIEVARAQLAVDRLGLGNDADVLNEALRLVDWEGRLRLDKRVTFMAKEGAVFSPSAVAEGAGIDADGPMSPMERMRELTTLLDTGLITQVEYNAKRQAIIESL